jgi:mRNA-degrading endonuclease RelE of RelBE toxin-antitoxin system
MSRNMSHNLGSHLIFYSSKDNDKILLKLSKNQEINDLYNLFKSQKDFLIYIKERMDFLALVSTGEAKWGISYDLENLYNRFFENEIIKKNIVKSEKIDNINISIFINWRKSQDNHHSIGFLLPHGQIGQHAFFTIMENYIRNTAKHERNEKRSNEKLIKIFINFNTDLEKYMNLIQVIITTEFEYDNEKLKKEILKLKCLLSSPILKKTGELDPEARGLKEMRIACNFLRLKAWNMIEILIPKNKIDEPPLIDVERFTVDGDSFAIDEDGNKIGFCFYLLKSMELLIIYNHNIDSENVNILRQQGVYIYYSLEEAQIDFPKTFPHCICILGKNIYTKLDDIKKRSLPLRLVLIEEGNFNNDMKNIIESSNGNGINMIKYFWKKWVERKWENYCKADVKIIKKSDSVEHFKFIVDHNQNWGDRKAELNNLKYYLPYSSSNSRIIPHIDLNKDDIAVMQFCESVFTKIVIIDERINSEKNKIYETLGVEESLEEIWKRQRVHFFDHEIFQDNLQDFLNHLKSNENDPYDFLIIHQGLLTKTRDPYNNGANVSTNSEVWNLIKNNVGFIVINSGSGTPDWVLNGEGYSLSSTDLETNILNNVSEPYGPDAKYELTQLLFSLREG